MGCFGLVLSSKSFSYLYSFKKYRLAASSCRGTVIIEAAVTLPLFLFMMMSLVDFMRIGFATANLQNAAHRMSRCVAVGYPTCSRSSAVATANATRLELESMAGISIANSAFRLCEIDSLAGTCAQPSAGNFGPDNWMLLEAAGQLSTIWGQYPVRVSSVFRNEPTVRSYTVVPGDEPEDDTDDPPGDLGDRDGDDTPILRDPPGRRPY